MSQLFISAATDLISQFGGVGTLKIASDGVYSDGEVIQTYTSYEVKVATFDYPQTGAGDKQGFGTLILEGDLDAYMLPPKIRTGLAQPQVKANSSLIVLGGTEWKIVGKKSLSPNYNDVIVYQLHLRK